MRIRATIVAGLLAAGSLLALATPASAHTEHAIGDLVIVVGFANEPAYAGQPNATQITFTRDGEPVTDVKGMTVTVASGGQESEPMELEPFFFLDGGELVFGTPGEYRAWFVPSQPGSYEFHFVGEVDGEEVDEVFRSGPKTFSDVEDVSAAAFPPVTAPSNDELATRIDQEATRTSDAVEAATRAVAAADDEAASARTVGLAGLVIGALGLLVAIVAVASSRRTRS